MCVGIAFVLVSFLRGKGVLATDLYSHLLSRTKAFLRVSDCYHWYHWPYSAFSPRWVVAVAVLVRIFPPWDIFRP